MSHRLICFMQAKKDSCGFWTSHCNLKETVIISLIATFCQINLLQCTKWELNSPHCSTCLTFISPQLLHRLLSAMTLLTLFNSEPLKGSISASLRNQEEVGSCMQHVSVMLTDKCDGHINPCLPTVKFPTWIDTLHILCS